jgi:erythromycin esterase-like protein
MKFFNALLLTLFFQWMQSQELKTIVLLPPESRELTDLSFLKEEIKDKQVVLLGEQTHMYGSIFEMKVRVIEYLHQELGFSTIAMESSMYDIWKMNQNGFNSKAFNDAIWGVWSNSLEFQRLVSYIEKNNLKVIGFDSQVNNTSQFVDDFFEYCKGQKIAIKIDKDDMGINMEGILENVKVDENDIAYKVYESELNRIIGQIEKLEPSEYNYYWKQFAKSLLACSQDAYYNKEEMYTMDFGDKNCNIRDKQMADNLLSYIQRNPNEKIIGWADNIHIENDNSSVKKPIIKDFISMGIHLKKTLKDNMYSLATIHANDSLLNSKTNEWHATPIKNHSFEDALNKRKEPYLFVTSNQEWMRTPKDTRLLNFVDFTDIRLDQLHDGYIFLQKATVPKREMERLSNTAKHLDVGKKIELIEAGQNVILKGQILDAENNLPVPFATLILKKEEIYRVADETGFYELPIKKGLLKIANVAISSIGFESKEILLSNLNDKVYLTPKFEELAEVVLIGNLTPVTVLKKAIANKELNHPIDPFNFYRFSKVIVNKDDTTELDLELITKDYDQGYVSPFIITQRVEQIKWNKNKNPQKYKYSSQFFAYRQNAIQYANILHKRKYKKFTLSFVKSNDPADDGLYILAFQTDRNKWNYTNRGYPTTYSGRVYINKENFAIVKVIENWETTLSKDEIEKHFKSDENYKNIVQTTIKEENICSYANSMNTGKYYATNYFNRSINETLTNENKKHSRVFEVDSQLYDFESKDVEEIEFEYEKMNQTVLNRVTYDKTFWDSFYKKLLDE